MTLALLTGLVAGVVHVFSGPDHLAAVAPFAAARRYSVWKAGLLWGLGHTWGVWLIALLAVAFKNVLPLESLSTLSELLVGVTLILIGLGALRRALTHRIHYHEHHHDGIRHAHFHVHARTRSGHYETPHEHSHLPLGIGLLHGVAGSAHLIAVLPALALPSIAAGATYVVGYGLGSIAAMTLFSWVVGRALGRWMRRYAAAYGFTMIALSLVAITVGLVWVMKSA